MDYLIVLDILGIIAFSVTGYLVAVKAELDIMGILIISFISALGGGIIRDVIVDGTPYVFTSPYPISVVILTVITAIIFKLHKKNNISNNYIFILADTIGLALFAVGGATIGLNAGFNAGGIIFLGLLTAIGGGIIRDVILNIVPEVLRNEVYGSVAIVLSIIIWVISLFTPITPMITIALIITGVVLRLIVIKLNLHLPVIR